MADKVLRRIDLMHHLFGIVENHRCAECTNLASLRYHDKGLKKCKVYGFTHSEASDWAKKWVACGMFNQPYSKEPIIEYVKHRSFVKKEVLQLEGQMSLEGTENE